MQKDLITKITDGILEITFNRPERKNAISRDMFEILLKNLEKNINNNNLRALFISGSGDAFSAGGDVKDMASREDESSLTAKTESLKKLISISEIIYTSPIPTVAVIDGVAAGAGLAISLACDFRISTERGKFTTAFSKVGFSGDFGISFFLTKMLGTSKAKELLYFSDIIDSKQALKLGLINFLIESQNKDAFVDDMKSKLKKLPPIAIKYMKKNILNVDIMDIGKSLEQEALYQMICSETEDHKNAVRAFVEKKVIDFKGE